VEHPSFVRVHRFWIGEGRNPVARVPSSPTFYEPRCVWGRVYGALAMRGIRMDEEGKWGQSEFYHPPLSRGTTRSELREKAVPDTH